VTDYKKGPKAESEKRINITRENAPIIFTIERRGMANYFSNFQKVFSYPTNTV